MFLIHKGELEPMEIVISKNGRTDNPVGATNPRLVWMKPGGTVVEVALVCVNLAAGKFCRYWVAGDTDEVGVHKGRVVIELPLRGDRTYPNTGAWFSWRVTV